MDMMWTIWIAAFGVAIEFAGFATLAYELVQTNKLASIDTTAIVRERDDFNLMLVRDGVGDGDSKPTSIEGGGLGKQL